MVAGGGAAEAGGTTFLPGRAKRPPKGGFGPWLVWIVAALALLGLVAGALWPQSSLFGRTCWRGDTSDRVVALTFDDGPNPPFTARVLDVLERENVRATFFLVGENVRRDAADAARIVREGHAVGNHTDHHLIPFALHSSARLQAEVSAAELTIHDATGQFPRLFRPPNGLRSPWLMRVLERDSLVAVTWDVAAGDWNRISAETIVQRVVREARAGSIILLHDGYNATLGADRSATARALPGIIEGLRARGFRFVTLPELLRCPATLPAWPPGPRRGGA